MTFYTGCYCSSAAVSVSIDLDAQLVLFPSRVSICGHRIVIIVNCKKLMFAAVGKNCGRVKAR